jgi:hypothetical protein
MSSLHTYAGLLVRGILDAHATARDVPAYVQELRDAGSDTARVVIAERTIHMIVNRLDEIRVSHAEKIKTGADAVQKASQRVDQAIDELGNAQTEAKETKLENAYRSLLVHVGDWMHELGRGTRAVHDLKRKVEALPRLDLGVDFEQKQVSSLVHRLVPFAFPGLCLSLVRRDAGSKLFNAWRVYPSVYLVKISWDGRVFSLLPCHPSSGTPATRFPTLSTWYTHLHVRAGFANDGDWLDDEEDEEDEAEEDKASPNAEYEQSMMMYERVQPSTYDCEFPDASVVAQVPFYYRLDPNQVIVGPDITDERNKKKNDEEEEDGKGASMMHTYLEYDVIHRGLFAIYVLLDSVSFSPASSLLFPHARSHGILTDVQASDVVRELPDFELARGILLRCEKDIRAALVHDNSKPGAVVKTNGILYFIYADLFLRGMCKQVFRCAGQALVSELTAKLYDALRLMRLDTMRGVKITPDATLGPGDGLPAGYVIVDARLPLHDYLLQLLNVFVHTMTLLSSYTTTARVSSQDPAVVAVQDSPNPATAAAGSASSRPDRLRTMIMDVVYNHTGTTHLSQGRRVHSNCLADILQAKYDTSVESYFEVPLFNAQAPPTQFMRDAKQFMSKFNSGVVRLEELDLFVTRMSPRRFVHTTITLLWAIFCGCSFMPNPKFPFAKCVTSQVIDNMEVGVQDAEDDDEREEEEEEDEKEEEEHEMIMDSRTKVLLPAAHRKYKGVRALAPPGELERFIIGRYVAAYTMQTVLFMTLPPGTLNKARHIELRNDRFLQVYYKMHAGAIRQMQELPSKMLEAYTSDPSARGSLVPSGLENAFRLNAMYINPEILNSSRRTHELAQQTVRSVGNLAIRGHDTILGKAVHAPSHAKHAHDAVRSTQFVIVWDGNIVTHAIDALGFYMDKHTSRAFHHLLAMHYPYSRNASRLLNPRSSHEQESHVVPALVFPLDTEGKTMIPTLIRGPMSDALCHIAVCTMCANTCVIEEQYRLMLREYNAHLFGVTDDYVPKSCTGCELGTYRYDAVHPYVVLRTLLLLLGALTHKKKAKFYRFVATTAYFHVPGGPVFRGHADIMDKMLDPPEFSELLIDVVWPTGKAVVTQQHADSKWGCTDLARNIAHGVHVWASAVCTPVLQSAAFQSLLASTIDKADPSGSARATAFVNSDLPWFLCRYMQFAQTELGADHKNTREINGIRGHLLSLLRKPVQQLANPDAMPWAVPYMTYLEQSVQPGMFAVLSTLFAQRSSSAAVATITTTTQQRQ